MRVTTIAGVQLGECPSNRCPLACRPLSKSARSTAGVRLRKPVSTVQAQGHLYLLLYTGIVCGLGSSRVRIKMGGVQVLAINRVARSLEDRLHDGTGQVHGRQSSRAFEVSEVECRTGACAPGVDIGAYGLRVRPRRGDTVSLTICFWKWALGSSYFHHRRFARSEWADWPSEVYHWRRFVWFDQWLCTYPDIYNVNQPMCHNRPADTHRG